MLVGIAVLTAAAVFYGAFLTVNLFSRVGVVVPLVALYLFWLFVRAHERIASALEWPPLEVPRATFYWYCLRDGPVRRLPKYGRFQRSTDGIDGRGR